MIVLRSDSGETHVRRHATWGMYVEKDSRAEWRRGWPLVLAEIGEDPTPPEPTPEESAAAEALDRLDAADARHAHGEQ